MAWHADLDTNRGQEATPIVVDGVLYVSTAWSKVKAYDAATGREIWDVNTIDRSMPYTITGAPRVVKGKVLIGNGGAELPLKDNIGIVPGVAEDAVETSTGTLIAWDPVAQRGAWRVERAGPANGGALSTAGGLVFQGTGTGRLTALDSRNGRELWSAETQTGVIAAPVSYEVEGEQYVAIVVGTGGSWAATFPGPTGLKGNDLPNVSRVLVYKMNGRAALPPRPALPARTLAPPPNTASRETVEQGFVSYLTFCARCHGIDAVNDGILPDLRYSLMLATQEAWASVVDGGALAANGMASFGDVLSASAIEAIRAYVIDRAHAAD